MTDIFVSYSRKDIAIARLLYQSLSECELDTWIDWERIPIGEKWWTEICQAIEQANVFMFIISRNSVGSKVCRDEINEALRHNKRIIPVVVDNLGPEVVGSFVPDLNRINWILFERNHIFQLVENSQAVTREGEDGLDALPKDPQFKDAMAKLVTAIHTDWEWVRYHTRLQMDALRWETNQRNPSYLIRGTELEEAESQLLQASGKDPLPTALQAEYVTASRQEETRRQQERLRLEQKARQRQRLALWAVGLGLVVALVLGALAWSQRNEAVSQSNIRATAQAVAVAESHTRATAEAKALTEASVRATAEADAVNAAHTSATAQAVAEEQRNLALSKQIAIQSGSMLDGPLDLALLLAMQSSRISADVAGKSALFQAVLHAPYLKKVLLTSAQDSSYGVAYSPDGAHIAAGYLDQIWIFDASSGALIQRYVGSSRAQVADLAYTPSWDRLAATRWDRTVELWDVNQGPEQNPQVIQAGDALLTALAISPDGRSLATGSINAVALWDLSTGELRFHFTGKTAPDGSQHLGVVKATSLAFSPDGNLLAASDSNGWVYFVDAKSGEQVAAPLKSRAFWGQNEDTSSNESVSAVAFHPDGKRLAVATSLGTAVVDLNTRQTLNSELTLSPLYCANRGVAFTPDGKHLVSGGCGKLDLVSVDDFSTELSAQTPLVDIDSLVVSPDGSSIVTGGLNGNVLLWRFDGQPWLIQDRMTDHVNARLDFSALDYSPRADLFAANLCTFAGCLSGGSYQNHVVVWKGQDYYFRSDLEGPGENIKNLKLSPGGKKLAGITTHSPTVYLWDIASRSIMHRMSVPGFIPASIAFDPSGNRLIASGAAGCSQADSSQCESGGVQVWDPATGKALGDPLLAGKEKLNRIAFRPDGDQFATVDRSDRLLLWDARTMRITAQVSVPTFGSGAYSVAYSPDGQHLAVGTGIGSVVVWDLSGQPLQVAAFSATNGSRFAALAISPDGKTLAAGSIDGRLYLWDLVQMKPLLPETQNDYQDGPDGQYISTITFDKSSAQIWVAGGYGLSVWKLDETTLKSEACRLANRDFTTEEWSQFFTNEPYQAVCSDQPIPLEQTPTS